MPKRATVAADASWCPTTNAGGWAVWIVAHKQGLRIRRKGQFHTLPPTSGKAELWALLNGAWIAAEYGATELHMQSDCTGALAVFRQRNDAGVQHLLACFDLRLTFQHVKAHLNIPRRRWQEHHHTNHWCDAQAKMQMRTLRRDLKQQRKTLPCHVATHTKNS